MSQTIDFARAALYNWARERRDMTGGMNLGYPKESSISRWMREGIVPPTKHKPREQSYDAALAETVEMIYQNMADKDMCLVIEAHYLYASKPAEWRFRKAGKSKSSYYRKLDEAHKYVAGRL